MCDRFGTSREIESLHDTPCETSKIDSDSLVEKECGLGGGVVCGDAAFLSRLFQFWRPYVGGLQIKGRVD